MTDANGLVNMRARYYNPTTMRFLNSDPARDGLNWYAYASGNPINRVDPSGLDAIYLNDKEAVWKQGHSAALVGSDTTGWNYFLKDGYGNGKWSKDNNVDKPFNSLQEFFNAPDSKRYDRAVYIQTNTTQDLNMTIYGDNNYKQDYSVQSNNCADLTAGILSAGNIPTSGDKVFGMTRPNSQYDNLVSSGVGTPFTMPTAGRPSAPSAKSIK